MQKRNKKKIKSLILSNGKILRENTNIRIRKDVIVKNTEVIQASNEPKYWYETVTFRFQYFGCEFLISGGKVFSFLEKYLPLYVKTWFAVHTRCANVLNYHRPRPTLDFESALPLLIL